MLRCYHSFGMVWSKLAQGFVTDLLPAIGTAVYIWLALINEAI